MSSVDSCGATLFKGERTLISLANSIGVDRSRHIPSNYSILDWIGSTGAVGVVGNVYWQKTS